MPVSYDHYFGGFDLSAHSLLGPNVIHFTCRKCETTLCRGLFSTGQLGYGTLFQMICWKSCSCCQSYYNATVVIAIANCQRAKILPIRASLKLPYATLYYIASRFILPWNFRARLYYAAAKQPRVFARLLVGNQWHSYDPEDPGTWDIRCI